MKSYLSFPQFSDTRWEKAQDVDLNLIKFPRFWEKKKKFRFEEFFFAFYIFSSFLRLIREKTFFFSSYERGKSYLHHLASRRFLLPREKKVSESVKWTRLIITFFPAAFIALESQSDT